MADSAPDAYERLADRLLDSPHYGERRLIRSCWADGRNDSNGVCQMNTGSILGGRPSLGAWVSYGLGAENGNLPTFVVLEDDPGKVVNRPRN